MKRLFLILSSVVVLASIFGVIGAFSLPTQIEETVALVNYQHVGRFDYLAYLKPSYLFGPQPQQPPPPLPPSDPKYPTELIDRFDMSFAYRFMPDKPVTRISEEVEVIAIVKKPGEEQEEITLLPKTSSKMGDFIINFTLDMTDNISGGDITINAYVYTTVATDTGPIFEVFTQSLAMRSKGPFVEVDGDLNHTELGHVGELDYKQQGEFDYEVHLTPGSPFGAITLKPPSVTLPAPPTPPPAKTVGPGEVIFSKLVDRMEVTFYYKFKSDKPVAGLTQEVEIKAILGDPEVWSKTFVLVPPTKKGGDFSISFPLDLDHFTEVFTAIAAETGVPAPRNLTIRADVHTVAQTDFGEIDEAFRQTLSTTLGHGTLEWREALVSVRPSSIETTRMIPNEFLALSVSTARIVFSILTGVFFPLSLWLLVAYVKSRPARLPEVEREVLRARRKFGERIAEATSRTPLRGEKIISLGSMEDLIKVADELGKPVIHQTPTTPSEPHAYYVFDGVTRYEYLLTAGAKEQGTSAGKTE